MSLPYEDLTGSDASSNVEIMDISSNESESEHSIEDDYLKESVPWSQLPSLAIEKVYSYLDRRDRCQMSLVCHSWSKEYGSPSVWKTVRFCIPERDKGTEIYPEVKFAREYGGMFRHVEVTCNKIKLALVQTTSRQLKMFFDVLKCGAQLLSIKFNNLRKYFNHLDDTSFETLFTAIIQFLESQTNLRTVEFRDCNFPFQESAEVLKALEHSSDTLQSLTLRGFVNVDSVIGEGTAAAIVNLSSFIYEKFHSIKYIETDHSQILEVMISRQDNLEDLSWGSKNYTLSRISLHCDCENRGRFDGISPNAWKYLQNYCPKLKLELQFTPSYRVQQEIDFYIVPHMPLKFLDFRLDRQHASCNIDIDVLLHRLLDCRSTDHLETMYILWMRPISHLPEVLLPFLNACKKLKCFQLFIRYPVNGIEIILKSWLENRPHCLTEAIISVSHVRSEEDYLRLTALADEYVPILQVMGLNLFLIAEYEW